MKYNNSGIKSTKICFLSTYAYPLFATNIDTMHGGAEIQITNLARGLAKNKNFRVTLLVGDFAQQKSCVIDNVTLIKTFNPKANEKIYIKALQAAAYLKKLLVLNPDIVFTSTANSTVGLVTFYCKLFRKKHIHRTAHENNVDKSWIRRNSYLGKIYQWGMENATVVLTQNQTHQELLLQNHDIKAVVFRNGFQFDSQAEEVTKEGVLWVARFEKWKGPNVFIKLAECLPEHQFTMVCPLTNNELYQEWDELKKRVQKLPNLRFIDQIPFNEIQEMFNQAKVFVNTSDTEGFPNTFIQAAIAKTPLLSYKVNPDNFIEKQHCGFFANGDFERLAEKCNVLLNNLEEWEVRSNGVDEYFRAKHDIKENLSTLKKIINEILLKA